jgi:hypothetical protein
MKSRRFWNKALRLRECNRTRGADTSIRIDEVLHHAAEQNECVAMASALFRAAEEAVWFAVRGKRGQ